MVRPAVAALTALSLLAGQPASHAGPESEFRLSFFGGLVSQAPGEVAGPGGRMAYSLSDGTTHRLTRLLEQHGDAELTTYIVATDEPDRRAKILVRRKSRTVRVEWTFQPATGITQVHEALTGNDAEHFLGGGANFLYTDLRHRVLLNKVRFTGAGTLNRCNSGGAPSPFFVSSRGYAVFPDTAAIGRLAFPSAVDDPPHCVTTPPPCPVVLGQPDRIR